MSPGTDCRATKLAAVICHALSPVSLERYEEKVRADEGGREPALLTGRSC